MIRSTNFELLDRKVASARVLLSLLAMLSLYVDPTTAGGMFRLTGIVLVTLLCHLAYSVGVYLLLKRRTAFKLLPVASTGADVLFATAIAVSTEGQTSPSYVFFVFAIIAAGVRPGLPSTVVVTVSSVALYLSVVAFSDGITSYYLMRAVYLAIAGYLIAFIGEQRAAFETKLRELEMTGERHSIARSLHDGYIQALAGIRLRLGACRELLIRDRQADVMTALAELQVGVSREYDEVRSYARSLAGLKGSETREVSATASPPRFRFQAAFETSSPVGEQVLRIVLEGLRNAWTHATASVVTVAVRQSGGEMSMTIDDDGIGFRGSESSPPWAIASRVSEMGGQLSVSSEGPAHLEITMPTE